MIRQTIIIIGITLVLLELSSWLLMPLLTSTSEIDRAERLELLERQLAPKAGSSNLLYQFHPYVGYTGSPGARPWKTVDASFNEYGLLNTEPQTYPYQRQADEFIIVVFGGSVAEMFANLGREDFSNALSRELNGREVVVLNLATAGHKQPQQLMMLQYALVSEFDFDFVLNLDGFNDLVLSVYNAELGYFHAYPSGHHLALMQALQSAPEPGLIRLLGAAFDANQKEIELLRLQQSSPWMMSQSVQLATELYRAKLHRDGEQYQFSASQFAQRHQDSSLRGPENPASDPAVRAIQTWVNASKMMQATSERMGIGYLHALQPNQYLPNSKPMSESEKQRAVNPGNPLGQIASQHYAQLQQAGTTLQQAGVAYLDLTQAFHDVAAEVYTDDCCHLNSLGNQRLASLIASKVGSLANADTGSEIESQPE